jgi:hypothetical protein
MDVIAVNIVRFVDDEPQPGLVECELTDAFGSRHRFIEKTAIVSAEILSRDSLYPQTGVIACEVAAVWSDASGRSLARVNTDVWGVESVDAVRTFVVERSLVRVVWAYPRLCDRDAERVDARSNSLRRCVEPRSRREFPLPTTRKCSRGEGSGETDCASIR